MYGYLRTDLAEGRVAELADSICVFADREGFDLGMIFHERDSGRAAFTELIHELRRAESRHVVVPSMAHILGHGTSRQALVARLWNEAHAGVWVADPSANHAEVRAEDRRRHYDYDSDRSGWADVEFRVGARLSGVDVAKLHVRHALSRWQLLELMAPVERVAAELVTDCVCSGPDGAHTGWSDADDGKPILVRLRKTDHLTVEVWDTRPEAGRATHLSVDPHVASLSSRSGCIRPAAGGTLTWAEFPIHAHV